MALREAAITAVIILFMLNAGAVLMEDTGLAADMGVAPEPGGEDEIDAANSSAISIRAEGGIDETLFSAFTAVADTFNTVFAVLFAGPRMLNNLGVPDPITTFIFAPMYLIVGIAVADIITGRFG